LIVIYKKRFKIMQKVNSASLSAANESKHSPDSLSYTLGGIGIILGAIGSGVGGAAFFKADANHTAIVALQEQNSRVQKSIGPPGAVGRTGSVGHRGAAGSVGLKWKGVWAVSTAGYAERDAVSFDGSAYICKQATSSTLQDPRMDTAHWDTLAGVGAGSLTWKGAYQAGNAYLEGAVVRTSNNILYMATRDATEGQDPAHGAFPAVWAALTVSVTSGAQFTTLAGDASKQQVVTFPSLFANPPLSILAFSGLTGVSSYRRVTNLTTAGCTLLAECDGNARPSYAILETLQVLDTMVTSDTGVLVVAVLTEDRTVACHIMDGATTPTIVTLAGQHVSHACLTAPATEANFGLVFNNANNEVLYATRVGIVFSAPETVSAREIGLEVLNGDSSGANASVQILTKSNYHSLERTATSAWTDNIGKINVSKCETLGGAFSAPNSALYMYNNNGKTHFEYNGPAGTGKFSMPSTTTVADKEASISILKTNANAADMTVLFLHDNSMYTTQTTDYGLKWHTPIKCMNGVLRIKARKNADSSFTLLFQDDALLSVHTLTKANPTTFTRDDPNVLPVAPGSAALIDLHLGAGNGDIVSMQEDRASVYESTVAMPWMTITQVFAQ
jgi:hypothetical protein